MNKVCIIIPCFNEQHRLPINEFIEFYSTNFNFLFVNDGSTDLTINALNFIKAGREDRIFILELKENQGKAGAVRRGMLYANHMNIFSIIGFLDADLSIPLDEARRLITYLEDDEVIFVFGSRIQRIGVNIKKKLYRHLLSRFFATVVSNMLKINVYDTQCGLKLFKSEIVDGLFKENFRTRWIFDVEIFYRFLNIYRDKNINKISKEIPLDICIHVEGSKIKFYDFVKIPIEMIKLIYQNNFKN